MPETKSGEMMYVDARTAKIIRELAAEEERPIALIIRRAVNLYNERGELVGIEFPPPCPDPGPELVEGPVA